MHEFTLALVGSINTFILDHYFLRRMLLVATLWTDGSHSWTNFRSMEITDTAFTNIAVCQMSSLLLILSTFFDDNSGAGSIVAEDSMVDCPRESRLPSKLPASVSM